MKIRLLVIATLVALVAFASASPAAFAKGGGGTKITTALKGSAKYPNAIGKAVFKSKGGETEFQVEVENIASLNGKSLGVFVNSGKIGSTTVDSLGHARLNLDSGNGQTVPTVSAGTTVEVKTRTGVLVASGTF